MQHWQGPQSRCGNGPLAARTAEQFPSLAPRGMTKTTLTLHQPPFLLVGLFVIHYGLF